MSIIKKKSVLLLVLIIFLCLVGTGLFIYKMDKQYIASMPDKFTTQWALQNTGQIVDGDKGSRGVDMNMRKAWKMSKGDSSVIIGVLDTGIQIDHPALKDAIFTNSNEISNNRIDDDQNGYIDDIHGWNFLEHNNEVYDNYLHDYHGTSMAGVIAASHETSTVAGIAPNVMLLPLKFMSGTTGSIKSAIEAIAYAHNMGVRIINCSWDSLDFNEELEESMRKHSDILFICSTGKSRVDIGKTPVYPACFNLENVISVAAITNTGMLYQYSGYGQNIDVAAPGEKVMTILPDGDTRLMDGTSIAAANITGAAALIQSRFPDLDAIGIARKLRANAKPLKDLEGMCVSGGIIDVYACLK